MKMLAGLAVLFFLAFAGSLLGVLALTGNLNADAMARLRGEGVEREAPSPVEPDKLDTLTRELMSEREKVTEEAERVAERQKRLELARQSLEDTYAKLQSLTAQLPTTDEPDPAVVQRKEDLLREQVATLLKLGERKAAQVLETKYEKSPQEVAQILSLMPVKDRAGVLGRMENPEEIADLLDELKPELAATVEN